MFFFVLERGPPKFCKSCFSSFERGPPDFCKSGFGSERWNPFDFPDLVFFGAGVFWFRTCFLAWMNLQPSAGRGMLFTLPINRLGQFSPSRHSTILILLIFCAKKIGSARKVFQKGGASHRQTAFGGQFFQRRLSAPKIYMSYKTKVHESFHKRRRFIVWHRWHALFHR